MVDLSPEEFRRLGYQAVDMIAKQLAELRESPVRQPVPAELRERLMTQDFSQPVATPDDLLAWVQESVYPYPMGNNHPRFFAWVNPTPAPLGVIADFLAAYHNPSSAGGDQSAVYIEHGLLNWAKSVFHFPDSAHGILTSGGSTANLVALAVMRHVKTGGAVRGDGLQTDRPPMVVYTSEQGHSCIQKAVELLGFGSQFLRKIPTDSDYRMNLDALRSQIAADKAAGLHPVCVAASAGTVNTGAIDPLREIAAICREYDLWFHVDGAYGGFGILAEQTAGLYDGIEQADSLAVDPHKWLYIPVECGCTLVRDKAAMRDTFSLIPPYLREESLLPWFSEFGIQQTRGFKALKFWMVLGQLGESGYRELITSNIHLSRQLVNKVSARPDFRLIASGSLSAACFVYAPEGLPESEIKALNQALLKIVQDEGHAYLTSTELAGQFALRTCIVNFRTTEEDLDRLLDILAEAGGRVLGKAS